MLKIIAFLSSYIVVYFRLLAPGGVRAIAAENLALRKQLITLARHRKRSPQLTAYDRVIFGILASMMSVKRLSHIAIILKPATILKFHRALVNKKYQWLFSAKTHRKPGPTGPDQLLIDAIIEMKRRNPSYGYRRIAMQISSAFGVTIDKDVVRRVLNKYYKDGPNDHGPSWLTFLGHMKDSLWSIDLFRCESIHLKSHWVMLVMDQFTRRIVGFATQSGDVNGIAVCRMFNKIIAKQHLPKYLSSDNDPLFTFHRWQANLRILDIEEIKSVPHVPTSHPFVERLIGTIRREFLDKVFFWNEYDLQDKLASFQHYYNENRGHCGIDGVSPTQKSQKNSLSLVAINHYQWKKHCRGLFELPIPA